MSAVFSAIRRPPSLNGVDGNRVSFDATDDPRTPVCVQCFRRRSRSPCVGDLRKGEDAVTVNQTPSPAFVDTGLGRADGVRSGMIDPTQCERVYFTYQCPATARLSGLGSNPGYGEG